MHQTQFNHFQSAKALLLAIALAATVATGCGDDQSGSNGRADAGAQADAAGQIDGAVNGGAITSVGPESTVAPSGVVELTVTLAEPAGVGGTDIAMSLSPDSTGSSVPALVSVAEGDTTADFTFTAGATPGTETVTATLGDSNASVDITIAAGAGALVINEVDYDQVMADDLEFVELFNGTGAAIDMSDYTILFANGGSAVDPEYGRFDLTGTLAAGGYFVVGKAALTATVPGGTLTIDFEDVDVNQSIQNGMSNGDGSPDGVALIQISNMTLVDSLSYEGEITAFVTDALGTHDLVEGTAATAVDSNVAQGSLSRIPNGADTDDADTDWAFVVAPTPGAANN